MSHRIATETLCRRETIKVLIEHQLSRVDLLTLGSVRARWLLEERRYVADSVHGRSLIADLLLAIAAFADN